MMDDKWFIGLGTTLIISLVAWAWKSVNEKVQDNEKSIQLLEEKMYREFQSKELASVKDHHMHEVLTEIRSQLKEINKKLDLKADK
ncbi:hypothetical protein BKG93_02350 [Rodentibacter ratti]|uniref:Uncharacterized protein n=2 Tax=Rodentibacter TaxID=1960084 RepID=A0A1V3L9U9_9PAST|nr:MULTISPECIES: hypothetical protein [Rodentibacter]OOF46928.1 hypothetical protein BKK52_10480 [Rodentibacter trehalosifermentans]OOF86722.1 hypothetical protein BKG93_02350 [Rodentibacter ratti]